MNKKLFLLPYTFYISEKIFLFQIYFYYKLLLFSLKVLLSFFSYAIMM